MGIKNRYGLVIVGICAVVALMWLAHHARDSRSPRVAGGLPGRDGPRPVSTPDPNVIGGGQTTGSPVRSSGAEIRSGDTAEGTDRSDGVAAARNGPAAPARPREANASASQQRANLGMDGGPSLQSRAPAPDSELELPIPEAGLSNSPEVIKAYEQTMQQACETRFWDIRAGYYEEFLQKYPLSEHSLDVMARLATAYAEMDRLDDARRMLEGARLLAGDNPFVNFLDVMLAEIDVRSRRLGQAEARLQEVMKRPIPGSPENEYAVAGQKFLAPIRLAGILATQGRTEESDRLLAETCRAGLEWTRTYSNIAWIPSYVTYASYERARLALNTRGLEDAVPIMDEIKQYLPSLEGRQGYGQVLELLAVADYSRAYTLDRGGETPAEVEGG